MKGPVCSEEWRTCQFNSSEKKEKGEKSHIAWERKPWSATFNMLQNIFAKCQQFIWLQIIFKLEVRQTNLAVAFQPTTTPTHPHSVLGERLHDSVSHRTVTAVTSPGFLFIDGILNIFNSLYCVVNLKFLYKKYWKFFIWLLESYNLQKW